MTFSIDMSKFYNQTFQWISYPQKIRSLIPKSQISSDEITLRYRQTCDLEQRISNAKIDAFSWPSLNIRSLITPQYPSISKGTSLLEALNLDSPICSKYKENISLDQHKYLNLTTPNGALACTALLLKVESLRTKLLSALDYIKAPLETLRAHHDELADRQICLPKDTEHMVTSTLHGSFMTYAQQFPQGSFGVVHEVQMQDRMYAMKRVTLNVQRQKKAAEYLQQELLFYLFSDHKNIVQLKAANSTSLFLEKINGPDLFNYLQWNNSKIFSTQTIKSILIQIAEALQHVHELRWKHKDLKPENILIDPHTHHIYLCDFGLSSNAEKDNTGVSTPEYRSPEMCYSSFYRKTTITFSYKTDTWSFGILILDLIFHPHKVQYPSAFNRRLQYANKLAFDRNFFASHSAHLTTTDPNGTLQTLAIKCLHGDPEARPSMQEILDDLKIMPISSNVHNNS